jgi:enoyl-CoA hydratase/carnithine racemase
MVYEHLIIEREENVAIVTINRHERRNTIAGKTLEELDAAFTALGADAGVGAVVITGAGGKAFCAGADLEEGFIATQENVAEIVAAGQRVYQKIENFPKPVVAAVTGYAFGGGFELMLSCDISVAEENVTMGQPEITRGLMPGWGGTQKIPRIAGKSRAMEIMLLGGRMRAPELAAMGLVSRVVPKGEGLSAAKDIARKLAKQPANVVALIKDAVLRGAQTTLEEGLEIEAENFARAFADSEWNKK